MFATQSLALVGADLLQDMFIAMKNIVFVGGYTPDKHVFAIVTKEDSGVQNCHLFLARDPVCPFFGLFD